MDQEIFEWLLLLGRWLHITVAVTWIGTSIFFMWLDRTFIPNPDNPREGHLGDLWMVHGGGFYQVEKMQMGPTKVPELLHWFKWESYWTWMSGMILLVLIFYTGEGTFLLDSSVSDLTYVQGLALSLFSIFGSWLFYDILWERNTTKESPFIGHFLTFAWLVAMTITLCLNLSGRAAYIHIGAMIGTWMAGNVFMRIIPRQVKMVEASKKGEPVNQDWAKNAKSRSTHNTYLTLPIIFIMASNHFPMTYGHQLNWLLLILLCIGGAAIRHFFVVRLAKPKFARKSLIVGVAFLLGTIALSMQTNVSLTPDFSKHIEEVKPIESIENQVPQEYAQTIENQVTATLSGSVFFEGTVPQGKKLRLPGACASQHSGDVYSDEVIVSNGKLENVFIQITKGLEGKVYSHHIPEQDVEIDQQGCIYHPKVSAARVGQKVVFINSDPIFHNVKSVTKNNKNFNAAMPKQDQRITKVFERTEMFVEAKCSVHPWMGAYVAVVDHPFYAVTRSSGSFEIKDLPVGKYTVESWHQVYGKQTKEIEVIEEGNININFTYKAN